MPTGTQIKAAQDKAEDDFITITGPDFDHLKAESLKAANECIKLIKEISKKRPNKFPSFLSTDNPALQGKALEVANELLKSTEEISKMTKKTVVIEEGGTRYVMERQVAGVCVGCKILDDENVSICGMCSINGRQDLTCISATKITPQPKMYFAWNHTDAAHLVGKTVEWNNGMIEGLWKKATLNSIRESTPQGAPFELEEAYSTIIREIPRTPMTLADALAKYVPDNIEIVEVY